MPIRLDSKSPDFSERFAGFLATKREASADVDRAVRDIIAEVAARGDAALIELSRKFDRVDLGKLGLRVSAQEIADAEKACSRAALDALKLARDRIQAFHLRQKPKDVGMQLSAMTKGACCRIRWRARRADPLSLSASLL